MNRIFATGFAMLLPLVIYSQTSICPLDPPVNPFLAESPYPIFHRNSYAQSSVCLPGPAASDSIVIKTRTNITGGTSPWIYFTDPYPDGSRAILYANMTHGFKFVDTDTGIVTVDSIQIDEDPLSAHFNFLQSRNKVWFVHDTRYDPAKNEYSLIHKFSDVNPDDPFSELQNEKTYDFADIRINRVAFANVAYDGNIIFTSDNDSEKGYAVAGVLTQDFELLDTLHYELDPDEMNSHNSNPIDEHNNFYVLTNKRLICIAWDGSELSLAWSAWYDFVADGPTGKYANGSGTTPTLMGWGEGNDKLVVMADGHAKNNLVAFWREVPEGWIPKPGMDPRFADSIRIPLAESFSNQFQSIECSPCVLGYDIGIAQCNGFLRYDCKNHLDGVQKISWDTVSNELSVAWVNDQVNMNSVLTVSSATNMVYGSGMETDCNYYYYGLDWTTGKTVLRHRLGPVDRFALTLNHDTFFDGGDNNIIDEDGNIFYSGGASLVKIESVDKQFTSVSFRNTTSSQTNLQLTVRPNSLHVDGLHAGGSVARIFNSAGRLILEEVVSENVLDISCLKSGMYLLEIMAGDLEIRNTFIKK